MGKKVGLYLITASIIMSGVVSYAEDFSTGISNAETVMDVLYNDENEASITGRTYTDKDGSVYNYTIINDGTAVKIDGHGSINTTELILPETIDGLPVEEVNGDVIRNTDVTSITLPKTCKKILGFSNNPKLETIILNDGLETIGVITFKNCTALKNIEIPLTVKQIEQEAFRGCTNLKSIEIPSGVEKIEQSTFADCSSLEYVKFNDGIKVIGVAAFLDCNLKKIDFSNSLVKIEGNAFIDNINLKTLEIPESVKNIGFGAFARTGLESIEFHGALEELGINALYCENLKEVEGLTKDNIADFWLALNHTPWAKTLVDEENPFIISSEHKLAAYVGNDIEVVIPDGVKTIGQSAFAGKNISTVVIPSSVTKIEMSAFYQCRELTEITIPSSVTSIGQLAFSNCDKLKNITFEYSNAILSLGENAFQFTAVTHETLRTNNRKYSNHESAFANTALSSEYSVLETQVPTETTNPTETPKPEQTAIPQKNNKITVVSGNDNISIIVGDKEVLFNDVKPFIDNSERTQIPIREVAEILNCKVDWDDISRTVTITKDKTKIILTIDSNIIQVNDKIIEMDTTAQIIDERTFIPIRFVGEAMGMEVAWENR